MKLLWEERAWADYLYWQGQDRKTLKRINDLLKDVQRNAFDGIGKPTEAAPREPLRLLEQTHRRGKSTVYRIQNDSIYVLACKGHY